MPYLRTYRIFVSHAWHRGEHYNRVISWLNGAANFAWENLSVPEHDPVKGNDSEALAYELRNQMRPADAFIILAGMYAAHSDWIDFELSFARRIGRPIIGVRPWGAERLPATIQNAATEIVGWNGDSIVGAVRRHALPSG
jgi:hypothetical protein